MTPQAAENGDQGRGVAKLLAQIPRPRIGLPCLRRSRPLGGIQRRAKRTLQLPFVRPTIAVVGDIWQEVYSLAQLRHRFNHRRARNRFAAGYSPVSDRLLGQSAERT